MNLRFTKSVYKIGFDTKIKRDKQSITDRMKK